MAAVDWYYKDNEVLNRVIVRSNREGIGGATEAEALKALVIAEMLLAPHHANARAREVIENREPSAPSYLETSKGSLGIDSFLNLVDPEGSAGAISPTVNLMWRVLALL